MRNQISSKSGAVLTAMALQLWGFLFFLLVCFFFCLCVFPPPYLIDKQDHPSHCQDLASAQPQEQFKTMYWGRCVRVVYLCSSKCANRQWPFARFSLWCCRVLTWAHLNPRVGWRGGVRVHVTTWCQHLCYGKADCPFLKQTRAMI